MGPGEIEVPRDRDDAFGLTLCVQASPRLDESAKPPRLMSMVR